jgi:hypothetical protein
MRCFIGFFGLTRSLPHTVGAIRAGFYEPLRKAGIDTLRAGHFNLPETITNPRSGEFGIIPDRAESTSLELDICWVEPQVHATIVREFEVARGFPDTFGDQYGSLGNLCHQLHSLERLWKLLELLGAIETDIVLLLRPDLLYLDLFDPATHLVPLIDGSADLIVPRWQGWGGLNDRFAFCTGRAAKIYATRIRLFADACLAMQGMHAERFLHFVARQQGLRIASTDLRAVRVRANGRIAANDFSMTNTPVLPPAAARETQPVARPWHMMAENPESSVLPKRASADTGAYGDTRPDWKTLSQVARQVYASRGAAAAIAMIRAAIKASPTDGNLQMILGEVLLASGRHGPALATLSEAMKLGTEVEILSAMAEATFPGPNYVDHLTAIHKWLRPATYLEIGVFSGATLGLAQPGTLATGVDPRPLAESDRCYNTKTVIHRVTSDAYFAALDADDNRRSATVDFAFIDGLHLYEQVLRDFINVETICDADSIVVLHDTLPVAAAATARQRQTSHWCGDVWKIRPCIQKYRPDLSMLTIPTHPSGLTLVTGLDRRSTILNHHFQMAVADFASSEPTLPGDGNFGDIANDPDAVLAWLRNTRGPAKVHSA